MVYAGPIFWEVKDARRVMQWYRQFLPRAPLELCPFLGLKTVPSTDPFPREHWGKKICDVNFMMDEGLDRVKATYRDNYDRLTEIKRKYDPGNFFRIHQNIRPN